MDNNTGKVPNPEWLRNLAVRSEDVGYAADELIVCGRCGRRNAPDRPACLYCGAEISTAVSKRIELGALENWENGYNVVAAAADVTDSEEISKELESVFRMDRELLGQVFRSGKPFPIARVGTPEAAASISELLARFNVEIHTVPDHDLLLDGPPIRLRSIEFSGGHVRLNSFAATDVFTLHPGDLGLIVSCVLLIERRESTEKRKRRSITTLDRSHISSDQTIIDIYSRTDPSGWRISASGFDFSSLQSDMSLLAHENMKRIATKLSDFATDARVIDDYLLMRPVLETCWPSEQRKDTETSGILTLGSKKTKNVFTTENTLQVTKYSRLQWHLL